MSLVNLLDLLPSEMESLVESLGAPRYRGRQLAGWIFGKGVTDLGAMSDLPKDLRQGLPGRWAVGLPGGGRVKPPQDGSRKLVWRLADGSRVQSGLLA